MSNPTINVRCATCSSERTVRISDWRKRKSDNCQGCTVRLRAGLKPSDKPTGKGTRLYNIWRGMRQRCGYIKGGHGHDLAAYRDRGIDVREEWRNEFWPFKCWAEANGYRDDLMIDRRDNDGDYSPDNCRWVSLTESNRNKRSVLDQSAVERIRECCLFGAKQHDLAVLFETTDGSISLLVNGHTFA